MGIEITATPQKILSIWLKRSRCDTSKSEVFSELGGLVFAYGVAKAGQKYHMGVILVNKWAPGKGMGNGMLLMHDY